MGERLGRAAAILVASMLAAPALASCGGSTPPEPRVAVVEAFTIPGEGELAVYLSLSNTGGRDEIVGAALVGPDAGRADRITLHAAVERDGLSIMQPAASIEVTADAVTGLDPGRAHLMLEGLDGPVGMGDELQLEIRFRRSAALRATVQVVTADEALERIEAGDGSGSGPR
ncbi:MAG: copper chaperone PCu(A)C [Acidimicrobiia bacterium]